MEEPKAFHIYIYKASVKIRGRRSFPTTHGEVVDQPRQQFRLINILNGVQ